jgi:hypothetical protein
VCTIAVNGLPVQQHQGKHLGNLPVRREERQKYSPRYYDRESALLKVALDGKVSLLLRSGSYIAYAIPSPDGQSLAIGGQPGQK